MDPPTQDPTPISIIKVVDSNIQYFNNQIAALSDKIIRAQSREHLKKQLEGEKSELQQLLELNQSFKQQWQNNLNKKQLRHQQNLDQDKQALDKIRVNLQATLTNLDPLVQQSKPLLGVTPTDPSHTFTYPEVTPFVTDIDQLAQETEDRIMRRVDTILQNQDDTIITEASKVTESYMQDINRLVKEMEKTKLLLAEKEKSWQQQKKYIPITILGGVSLAILCALYVTKYFLPQ